LTCCGMVAAPTSLGTGWMRSIMAQRSSRFLSWRLFLPGLTGGMRNILAYRRKAN
jgi:hypothetical protein